MTHIHTKFLLRRLAYVPWLLTVGLVLGWNGDAVADPAAATGEADHSDVLGHTHATDPYLHIDKYVPARATDDATTTNIDESKDWIIVRWETAYSKNFHTGNVALAKSYEMTLFKGESLFGGKTSNTPIAQDSDRLTINGGSSVSHSGNDATIRRDTLVAETNLTSGFYWVRMKVQVDDEATQPVDTYFAKQTAVLPDYKLSVNPSSVREDNNKTVDIQVTVTNSAGEVSNDTTVPLTLGSNPSGLNSRFRIEFPTITIPEGKKSEVGTIRFTAIDSDTTPDDDLLVTIKTTGALTADGSTDIRLIDTDKKSTAINLSFDKATINKNDGRAEIEVTATLNGAVLKTGPLTIPLVIDNGFDGGVTRDVDYTATVRPVIISRNNKSGAAMIIIQPRAGSEKTSAILR